MAKMTRVALARLYIIRDGKRVYFATVNAARKAAQLLADKLGQAGGVGRGPPPPASYRRNPSWGRAPRFHTIFADGEPLASYADKAKAAAIVKGAKAHGYETVRLRQTPEHYGEMDASFR